MFLISFDPWYWDGMMREVTGQDGRVRESFLASYSLALQYASCHFILPYSIISYSIALYCIISYRTVLHYIVLYSIVFDCFNTEV